MDNPETLVTLGTRQDMGRPQATKYKLKKWAAQTTSPKGHQFWKTYEEKNITLNVC